MALKIISDPKRVDREKWEAFVLDHPDGSVFQLPGMFDVHEHAKYQRPAGWFAFEGDNLVGLMVSVNFWNAIFPMSLFTRRQVVFGGPLVAENDMGVLLALLEALVKETGRKAVFSEIRNLKLGLSLKPLYEEAGFYYESHLSVGIDMSRKSNDLWASLSPSRRDNIQKMGTTNHTIRNLHGSEDVYKIWDILRCYIGRKGRPIPDLSLFQSLDQSPLLNTHLRIKGMEINHELKAVILIMIIKNRSVIWFDGHCLSDKEFWKYDGFLWGVIQELQSEGIRYLDLGTGGRPGKDYFARQYKKSYGGMVKETGRYIYVHNWLLWGLGKVFYRWYKRIRRFIFRNYCYS
ncbi:hypothetical protein [Marinilabilia rubra]|uniref:BioF2-like acetyltransferase domain-containing protein n=1 Tax=Marinilabilia rubra TaxID=2162893 RepID=A0A2U2BBD7_9BACT|nr:hypothetical protein [Marinilabilia rubra]PWE00347.1 hypothetical protein DDZ16_05245 [Marinilabilia rubra]